MKSLIIIGIICSVFNLYSQDSIPGWPCTGTAATSTQYINSTITLKVLLVEFTDIKHRNPSQDGEPAYTFEDFENLLFSSGSYASPNKYSPDGETVFGSLHDYYHLMSDGNLNLTGSIVNIDENDDDVPDWIQLDYSKQYYQNQFISNSSFYSHAISKAQLAGLNVGNLGSNTKLVIIYAGHMYRRQSDNSETKTCGLTPRVPSNNTYIMSEQFGPGYYHQEHPSRTFSHIGTHAHEFGHLLGFPDLYHDYDNNGDWDLMAVGNFNGPGFNCACPAPINPYLRYLKGWISFDNITVDNSFQADYNLQDPEVFKVTHSSNSSIYFLIECRKFNSNMTIGSTSCPDYNTYMRNGSQTQGILVWRRDPNNVPYSRILHANGLEWTNNRGDEGDLFPGNRGVKVLSPWSDARTGDTYTWAPNTKPSNNCGMEITSSGSGYYQINLYNQNPINASPTYPKNLQISSSGEHPVITWDANIESDLASYKIYKKTYDEMGWFYLTTTSNDYYEDLTEEYLTGPHQAFEHNVDYKVTAYDTQSLESVASDPVTARVAGAPLDKQNPEKLLTKPVEYSLSTNYPNPFNPTTQISYSIKEDGFVILKIYDVLGNEITTLVNEPKTQGNYSINFDASHLPDGRQGLTSGVYIYTIKANNFFASKKMLLTK